MKKRYFLLFLVLLFACSEKEAIEVSDADVQTRGSLVTYTEVATMTEEDVAEIFSEADADVTPLYNVTVYRITYASINDEQPIVLSGLVLVPDATEPVSHFQYHHGTLFPDASVIGEGSGDAPSLYEGGGSADGETHFETIYFGVYPASQGVFVSLPDYAGYGASDDVEHPYTVHPELANQSVDMILAAQALASELDVALDDHLFLGGWSEGGGATLATHKLIDESYADQLTVTASAPFAGPYHMTRFYETIALAEDAEELTIYNWAIYSHYQFLEPDLDADEIWAYEIEDQWDALEVPDTSPTAVFNPDFMAQMQDPTDEELLPLWEELNLHEGWQPRGIIYFHSGKADTVVPHFNTIDAYNGLNAEGGNVVLYEYEGDHVSPVYDYLQQMLADFEGLR